MGGGTRLQLGRAVRTASGFEGDLRDAVGALFGGRGGGSGRRFFFLGAFDPAEDHKNGKRDNDEVDDGIEEHPIV